LLERKNSKEMKRKIWKKIHLICIRVQEKGKKQVRKCVVEGFPPFIVEDFYTGKFGWEVERWLHSRSEKQKKELMAVLTSCLKGPVRNSWSSANTGRPIK
jgi:hypothetical protein